MKYQRQVFDMTERAGSRVTRTERAESASTPEAKRLAKQGGGSAKAKAELSPRSSPAPATEPSPEPEPMTKF
jgi:hypothetical protein